MRFDRRARVLLAAVCLTGAAPASRAVCAQTPDDSTVPALLARGDAAWTRGARDSAYAAYRVAVQRDTVTAAPALTRLAVLEAERHRLGRAAALLRVRLRLEPGDDDARVLLARVTAWSARYDDAIAIYGDVLAHDSTHLDAALGLAQTLAWAGRLDEAERWFSAVARRGPSPDAERGLARIAARRGELLESEARWRAVSARYPEELENWLGLAQAQRWAGHIAAADTTLRRALALDPSSAEAREQLSWVRSDLSHAAEPVVTHASDSDGNRSAAVAVTLHSRSVGVVRWRVTGTLRDVTQPGLDGTSAGGRARVSWSAFDSRFITAAELGATRLASRGAASSRSRTVASGLLLMFVEASERARVGLALSRGPFDETAALIAGGITTTALDADATLDLPGALSLNLTGGRAALDGGRAPNARRTTSGALRWRVRPAWLLSATARGMACDTTGLADGYFCPDGFRLFEAGVRTTVGDDRDWGFTVDAGLGRQSVRDLPSDAWRFSTAARASAGIRFRPAPGYELEATYGFSTSASLIAQDPAGYSHRLVSLRGRVRL